MPWYSIKGDKIYAESPDQAVAKHREQWAAKTAAEDMNWGEQALAGIGGGMLNAGTNIGNMLGLVSDEDVTSQSEAYGALGDTTAGMLGQIGGEVLATAPLGMGAGALAGRVLPGAARAAGLGSAARNAGIMATEGATEGAILAGPGQRGQGAVLGAGLGGTVSGIGSAAGRMVRGAPVDAQAQRLLDAGVDLTPGQVNPGGVMSQIEASMGGRQMAAGARQNAVDDTFRAILREASPTGQIDEAAHSLNNALDDVYQQFGQEYDKVRGFPISMANQTGGGRSLDDLIDGVVNRAPGVTDDARKAEQSWLQDLLSQTDIDRGMSGLRRKFNDPTLVDSGTILKMRSNLRTRIREKRLSGNTDYDVIRMLQSTEEQLTKMLDQLPGRNLKDLKAVDSKYGTYKLAEDILVKRGDTELTPNRMSQAVKQATESGQYARGGGRVRDLVSAGAEKLPQKIGATGAALFAPIAGGAIGAAAGGLTGEGNLGSGTAIGAAIPAALAAALSGTRGGRAAYRGATRGQRVLQRTLDGTKPALNYLNPAARAAAIAAGWRED